ncbi:MAG: alpha/beta hydrolase fold-containing protein [Variovorax sp.]|nr:alpha/beta hydrolase fold-containing protein [Variovorax sp.]
MAYWQWGDPRSAHVVLCVHGLTRQGRDFDALARALLERAEGAIRIVCPDVAGRGRSDWLRDPLAYQLPTYARDMLALLAQLQAEQAIDTLDHVGTSMGGLIGIALAGQKELPLPVPVRRLVLNDVGPALEPAALQRIGRYVGQGGRYASLAEGAAALRELSSGFGPHSTEQWLTLSAPMLVPAGARTPDGTAKVATDAVDGAAGPFLLHYDPAIAEPFRAVTAEGVAQAEAAMWSLYDAITAPTLLVRGAESDLLSPATAQAMTRRRPCAWLVEFAGVGHAPTLVAPDQRSAVVSFLLG